MGFNSGFKGLKRCLGGVRVKDTEYCTQKGQKDVSTKVCSRDRRNGQCC